jgi:hypothetical protein
VGRKALTFEARVSQRVDERDQPRAAAVFGEAGDLPVDADSKRDRSGTSTTRMSAAGAVAMR